MSGPRACGEFFVQASYQVSGSAQITRSAAFRDPLAAIGVQTNTEVTDLAGFQNAEVVRWQKAVRDSGAVNE